MHSKDMVTSHYTRSRVALNYRLIRKKMYGVMKTSGNEEDKKNTRGGTWSLPEQIFLSVKRRKKTVRFSTLL